MKSYELNFKDLELCKCDNSHGCKNCTKTEHKTKKCSKNTKCYESKKECNENIQNNDLVKCDMCDNIAVWIRTLSKGKSCRCDVHVTRSCNCSDNVDNKPCCKWDYYENGCKK